MHGEGVDVVLSDSGSLIVERPTMCRRRWPHAYYLCALLILTGCGQSSPVAPTVGVMPGTRAVVTAVRATSPSTRETPAAQTSPTWEAGDRTDFADRVRDKGFVAERVAEASEPFLRTSGVWLRISGGALTQPARLAVYTYDDSTLAAADTERVQPDTSFRWTEPDGNVRTLSYAWVAPPHFFRRERVLVLYTGTDPAMLTLLTDLLGAQFAGR